jgi:hypothetical protein
VTGALKVVAAVAASTGGREGASDVEPVDAALGLAVAAEVPAAAEALSVAREDVAELVAVALGAAAAVVAAVAAVASVARVAVLAEVGSVIGIGAF